MRTPITPNPSWSSSLVIDQFRGDYVERYRDDFKTASGLQSLPQARSHFTDCYYDYANTMTAPGHSTIGTEAYTRRVTASRSTSGGISSAPHPSHLLRRGRALRRRRRPLLYRDRSLPPQPNRPPPSATKSFLATSGRAKLFGISLKDRAAIPHLRPRLQRSLLPRPRQR